MGYRPMEGIRVPMASSVFPIYKVIVYPKPRIPAFVSKKPEKGWLFVDEVFFN